MRKKRRGSGLLSARMQASNGGEKGSALVLALIWMVVFSVLTGALLASAASNQRMSQRLGENDDEMLAADGGINAGITHIRTDPTGLTGSLADESCTTSERQAEEPLLEFEGTDSLSGNDVEVWCYALDDSGQVIDDPSLPPYSVLALDYMTNFLQLGGTLRFQNDVHVNNQGNWLRGFLGTEPMMYVDDGSFTLADYGFDGSADDPCGYYDDRDPLWDIIAEDGLTCDPALDQVDPNWARPFTWEPAEVTSYRRDVPSCASRVPAGDGVHYLLTFQPGFYTDGPALASLFDGSCPNTILWFSPDWTNPDPNLRGNYLFDLEGLANGTLQVVDPTTQIIAGEPKGWVPGVSVPSFPGACMLEDDYDLAGTPEADRSGVVWMFGGETNMFQWQGLIEMCPKPSATENEVSFYQLKNDYPSGGGGFESFTYSPTGNITGYKPPSIYGLPGWLQTFLGLIGIVFPDWQNVGNARYVEPPDSGGPAASWESGGWPNNLFCAPVTITVLWWTWTLADSQCTLDLVMENFQTTGLDPDDELASAMLGLDMWFQNVNFADPLFQITATMTFDSLPPCVRTLNKANGAQSINLASCGVTTAGQLDGMDMTVHWEKVRKTGSGVFDGTVPRVYFDGAEVDVTTERDYMRGQVDFGGCPVTQSDNWLVCPLLGATKLEASTYVEFAIHGSVYAPAGAIRAFAGQSSGAIFRRGVVTNRLWAVKWYEPGLGDVPIISVPESETLDRDVILLAFARPSDGSGSWHLRTEVLAHFYDGGGSSPGEAVDIKYYKVCRLETEPSGSAICPL